MGAHVVAKQKMKRHVKTIMISPAGFEDGSFLPLGHNLVTPTDAKTTKHADIVEEPVNKHLRRPNLSTVHSAMNVEAKLTTPRMMEVSKESSNPTAWKMVVP